MVHPDLNHEGRLSPRRRNAILAVMLMLLPWITGLTWLATPSSLDASAIAQASDGDLVPYCYVGMVLFSGLLMLIAMGTRAFWLSFLGEMIACACWIIYALALLQLGTGKSFVAAYFPIFVSFIYFHTALLDYGTQSVIDRKRAIDRLRGKADD